MSDLPAIPLLRTGGHLRAIPVAAIRPARRNPRTDAAAALAGLTASLGAGMVQHPIVIPVGDDAYELIDGERRWRGAQAAGMAEITCLVADGGTPSATLFTQIIANLHRQDLGPLDESAALKAAWLVLNAQELGVGAQADAILGDAQRLGDVLVPLRALLDGAGWNWREPPVSQAVFVERLGLAMSAAVMRKKLQVLGATEEIQEMARTHRLTAASIRALMTLEPEQQATVLTAIDADPPLAKQVRALVQGVKQKGRTIAEAISVVSGRAPGGGPPDAEANDTGGPVPAPAPARTADGSGDTNGAAEAAPARPPMSEDAAMDAVLPIIELAQDLETKLAQLRGLMGGDTALDALPGPWGDYASEAMRLITATIQPYTS
ncbi:ParB N-terminal domain-containing protein [Chloroflexales bacterium ZM16-3]|nr:ParB N-terminal domain-containing protein [Chloroflexales bacterium ZM16-3]